MKLGMEQNILKAIEQKEGRRGIFEDPQGQDYTGEISALPQNAEIMSCVVHETLTGTEGVA